MFILFRDHFFDMPDGQRVSATRKLGMIWIFPQRGLSR